MSVSVVGEPAPDAMSHSPGFRGWQMVARAFFCQNVANGLLFGIFGTTLLAVQARYGSSRTTVSLGMAVAYLTMGLLSPLIAKIIRRLTLRWTMVCGVILSGTGYLVLAIAPNTTLFLLAYALLIGPSIAMFGSMTSSILASNWFVARQGTAVGIVNVSLFVTFAPLAAIVVIDKYGLTTLYMSLAAGHLLLLPAVLTIVERPEMIGQRAFGAGLVTPTADLVDADVVKPPVSLMRQKTFWMMVGGGGVLNAISIVAVSHIVALAVERNLGAVQASLLVSVIGAAAMLGALLVGALCDRFGPARALGLAGAGLCAAWACFFTTTWLPALFLAVALHGVCSGGVFPAISVFSRHVFGGEAMARAIGLFFPLTLPLTFCAPPAAGWVHDVTGSYDAVIISFIIGSGLVSGMFFAMWHTEQRQSRRSIQSVSV